MPLDQATDFQIHHALKMLDKAGFTFHLTPPSDDVEFKLYSLTQAAQMVGMSKTWMKTHVHLFPNYHRYPGGHIRIEHRDIENFLKTTAVKNLTKDLALAEAEDK